VFRFSNIDIDRFQYYYEVGSIEFYAVVVVVVVVVLGI